MAKKPSNAFQLALDLRRGRWLIQDPGAFIPMVESFFNRESLEREPLAELVLADASAESAEGGAPAAGENRKKVMIVPLCGIMTKYDTCDAYGTTTVARQMAKYVGDKNVAAFVLDVDSPGGNVSAIAPLVEVIRKARSAGQPVVAHCDGCYSAAYWVSSQCDAIFADNKMSGFGSIGAYAELLDDRENKQTGFHYISVYAKESKDKNLAVREALDGNTERLAGELSDLVKEFHAAVKAGRPALKVEEKGVLSGADFRAEAAIGVGLADGMATLEECIQIAMVRAEYR